MTSKKPPRVRMVVIGPDNTKVPVPPFNRESQWLREKEARRFGLLHVFKT